MGKVELNIQIDADLLEVARRRGVALDAASEDGIRAALARMGETSDAGSISEASRRHAADPEGAAARAQQWAEENAVAIEQYRKRIEERGVFGDDLRRW